MIESGISSSGCNSHMHDCVCEIAGILVCRSHGMMIEEEKIPTWEWF